MSHLILVRHGQSEWNLEKKFTGWVDVELAPNGKLEACKSGELINCLLYTSPSPRDGLLSRMPSSA